MLAASVRNFPAAQLVHTAYALPLHFPEAQIVQSDSLLCKEADVAESVRYFPAPQLEQLPLPCEEYFPLGQITHALIDDCAFEPWYVPAIQCLQLVCAF